MPFSCHRTMRLVIAAAGVIIAIFLRFVTGLSREGWLAIDLIERPCPGTRQGRTEARPTGPSTWSSGAVADVSAAVAAAGSMRATNASATRMRDRGQGGQSRVFHGHSPFDAVMERGAAGSGRREGGCLAILTR